MNCSVSILNTTEVVTLQICVELELLNELLCTVSLSLSPSICVRVSSLRVVNTHECSLIQLSATAAVLVVVCCAAVTTPPVGLQEI